MKISAMLSEVVGNGNAAMIVTVDGSGSGLAKVDVEKELVEPDNLASCTTSG